MKRPRQGIRSTTPKNKTLLQQANSPVDHQIIPMQMQEEIRYQNIIPDDSDALIANIFCFGAFADKNTNVIYNDMTGNFPFVSLDGSVCYFIMYHYESKHPCHTNQRPNQHHNIRCLQTTIWNAWVKGVQS